MTQKSMFILKRLASEAYLLIPPSLFLLNPFLFMIATLVEVNDDEHGNCEPISRAALFGSKVASLSKLHDDQGAGEQMRQVILVESVVNE